MLGVQGVRTPPMEPGNEFDNAHPYQSLRRTVSQVMRDPGKSWREKALLLALVPPASVGLTMYFAYRHYTTVAKDLLRRRRL